MSEAQLRPLIVVADDYGISPGVSRGIRELAEAGRISATGSMVSMPHWPEAAVAIKPLIGRIAIGLHLTLTDQRPVGPMPHLAPEGKLPSIGALTRAAQRGGLPLEEIAGEVTRQLDAFQAQLGRPPDFIDGHQHCHQLPGIREQVVEACMKRLSGHGSWIRDTWETPLNLLRRTSFKSTIVAQLGRGLHRTMRQRNMQTNHGFTGIYPFGQVSLGSAIPRMLRGAGAGTILMVHPGHPDAELAAVDTWVEPREGEFAYLAGADFPRDLATLGFRVAAGAPFPG
jgi:predicted glycoside hydrolase/deacetylase ChbG (UPF0249 family)